MTYNELEQEIMRMSASATHPARLRVAWDTIVLLRSSASEALRAELSDSERTLLAEILDGVERGSFDGLSIKLKQLTDSLCTDESRAIEFHPDVTELLCALDNLMEYSLEPDPKYIGKIAINMVNSIDHAIGGDSPTYSIKNILAAERRRDEYERQRRFLVS